MLSSWSMQWWSCIASVLVLCTPAVAFAERAQDYEADEESASPPVEQPLVLVPPPPSPKEGRFVLQVGWTTSEGTDIQTRVRRLISESHVLDLITNDLSDLLKLPQDVLIRIENCGVANAFYQASTHRIILCDELVLQLVEMFSHYDSKDKFRQAVLGSILFFALHEVGHALVHELDLPVVAREEDAVDALATYLLTLTGRDEVALKGAESFAYLAEYRDEEGPLWDEHSLDEQRFYNILCLVYGSNPSKYSRLMQKGLLPKARAERCLEEYQQTSRGAARMLAPHLRARSPEPSSLAQP